MRIIPDGTKEYDTASYLQQPAVRISDTTEITDDELDKIGSLWIMSGDLYHQHLSIFFKKLIQLKRGIR